MLYHNNTTLSEDRDATASPTSAFGDVVDPAPLRAALTDTADLSTLCDTEILASFMRLEQSLRLAEALRLRFFQEIASRSPDEGPSLARDNGYKNATDLLVRLTGSSFMDVKGRLELATALPPVSPDAGSGWASSSPDLPDTADPSGLGDLPPPACDDPSSPGSSTSGPDPTSSDPTGPASPEPRDAEPLFSYIDRALRSGELPEKTALKFFRELTKLQHTPTTPVEKIKHAEKVMVGHAIGAHIPDDPSADFDLHFNLTGTDTDTTGAGTGADRVPPADGTRPSGGTTPSGDTAPSDNDSTGIPGASDGTPGDTTGDTTGGSAPIPPTRVSRPKLPVPTDAAGREAERVRKTIAPTPPQVEEAQLSKRDITFGRTRHGLTRVVIYTTPENAALIKRGIDTITSPRTTKTENPEDTAASTEPDGSGNSATQITGVTSATKDARRAPNGTKDTGGTGNTGVSGVTSVTGTGVRFTSANGAGDTTNATEHVNFDTRTPAQKRHDAFATLMEAALKTGHLPQTANGAATLVVTISEEELAKPDGTGRMIDHFGKETTITSRTARHTACNGKVMLMRQTRTGRIVELENYQRVFTEHQRKAIIARDGGCVIPGCDVPAGWCEIHHVIPWAESQVTDVNQGASLCWFHHRTIETSGWDIRMRDGVPEIKAPPGIDPEQRWRQARPRVPEHVIMLTPEPVEAEPTTIAPGALDWGTFQTEKPF